ncbi:MAG: hypothetical protein KDF67_01630, partial [Ottowia sp.]|nr:hypothetical protein [Ottowia sp.]
MPMLRQVSVEQPIRRSLGALAMFWLLATLGVGMLAGLGGCAGQQPGFSEGVPSELHTPYDDTDA